MRRVIYINYLDKHERCSGYSTGLLFTLEDGSKVEQMSTDVIEDRIHKSSYGQIRMCMSTDKFNSIYEELALALEMLQKYHDELNDELFKQTLDVVRSICDKQWG